MPDFVLDLQNRALTGIGAKPQAQSTSNDSTMSAGHAVKYRYVNMVASDSNTRFSCATADHSINSNGCYLHFQDDWSTMAPLDILRPVVASGNFSGCGYKVFRTGGGGFMCAHIARPNGPSSDANMNLISDYAAQKGWTEIRSFTTSGLVTVAGCSEVYIVSQLHPGHQYIQTIRLEVNNMGQTLRHTTYTDNI